MNKNETTKVTKFARSIAALALLCGCSTPAPSVSNADKSRGCFVVSQSKTPPYALTVNCDALCNGIGPPPTVDELVAAGIDPQAAAGVRAIQVQFRQRCANKFPKSN